MYCIYTYTSLICIYNVKQKVNLKAKDQMDTKVASCATAFNSTLSSTSCANSYTNAICLYTHIYPGLTVLSRDKYTNIYTLEVPQSPKKRE